MSKEQLEIEVANDEKAADLLPEVKAKKSKSKKEKAPSAPLTRDGIIIYSDAGARPNPGFAGWGIHGYIYNNGPAKKGNGAKGNYVTSYGYQLKNGPQGKLDEVIPLHYFDGMGTLPHCSNNLGELQAAINGLYVAKNSEVKYVTVITDSQYVIRNTNNVFNWEANNWQRPDGQPVANVEQWKVMAGLLKDFEQSQINVQFEWVKGHKDNIGNINADRHATMGVMGSREGESYHQIVHSPVEGYWNGPDCHALLHYPCTLFISNPQACKPGEYLLANYTKDHDLLGMRDSETAYAYVILDKEEELIETIRDLFFKTAKTEDALAFVSLNNLYNTTIGNDIKRFGAAALKPFGTMRHDYVTADSGDNEKESTPILKRLQPPRIAVRAFHALSFMKGLYLDWQQNPNTQLVATDLTDLLYEKDAKGQLCFKKDYCGGVVNVDVKANYSANNGAKKTTELTLKLGIDLPERNALKKVESMNPQVTLITWREGMSVRYATIIEIDDAIGIWSGFYANMKYLPAEAV